jgi:pimeloyl-ACP methyl ester carboxylesterase
VLEALGVSDALAVGHSAGATTALMVAEDVPGTFRRLLLIDPILIPPRPPGSETARRDNPMAAKTRTRRLVWPSREFLFESFRRRPPYDTWTEEALAAYVEYGTFDRPDAEVELLCPGRLEAKVYMASSEFDGFAVLEGAKTPLRIVAGSRSDAFYGERVDRARTMVGAEHLLIVEDATHFIPMERPDLTAELVIAELSARG